MQQFTERAKLIALAIVHIFETGKAMGDYSVVAVLDDGAGVSYGINQFTHRSGSLLKVVQRYLNAEAATGIDAMIAVLPLLRDTSPTAIAKVSADKEFKAALRKAGKTPEMQAAQQQVMEDLYLTPAVEACSGSHFTLPLSLAVIYDSINHGSYGAIRDKVSVSRSQYISNVKFERAWVEDYCRERLKWLKTRRGSLRNTVYRPEFFIEQIEQGNWSLELPLNVRGVRLTEKMFQEPAAVPAVIPPEVSTQSPSDETCSDLPEIVQPPAIFEQLKTETPGASTEATAFTFTPQTFTQYIPQISSAKRWLGSLSVATSLGTFWGMVDGLPAWAIAMLSVLAVAAIAALAYVFVGHRRQVFAIVEQVIRNNADPATHNIELTTEK
jgi:hypothetical protein